MLLEIFDIAPLRNFFDLIYDSANVVRMKLDQDKLSINLLNNSHVAFYSLEISKSFFGDYTIDGAENVLVFVEDFYKILKSASKDDVLYLESNDSHLICKFEHENNRRVFELPLAEEYGDSPVPPSIPYDGEFSVDLDDLKQACNDLDKIVKTDKFKASTNNDVLTIVAPTDAMTQYNYSIDVDCMVYSTVIVNIEYIKQLLRLSKINKNVILSMGNNTPLKWNITSIDEMVKVSGLVAPILEEEC